MPSIVLWLSLLSLANAGDRSVVAEEILVLQARAGTRTVVVVAGDDAEDDARRLQSELKREFITVQAAPEGQDPQVFLATALQATPGSCGVLVRRTGTATSLLRAGTCAPAEAGAPPPPPPSPTPVAEGAPPPPPPPVVAPPAPPPSFVAGLFHVRMGGAGVSWDPGASFEIQTGEQTSWGGSLFVAPNLYFGLDGNLRFRQYFRSFSRGGFSELGLGGTLATFNLFDEPPVVDLRASGLLGVRRSWSPRSWRRSDLLGGCSLVSDFQAGLRLELGAPAAPLGVGLGLVFEYTLGVGL